jgi:glycerol-3-phosphate acyltransferase PlsY
MSLTLASSALYLAPTLVVVAYLVGSLSSAILLCRLLGHADPRTVGSKNPGATNVLRNFGKVPAALTLVGDVLKGLAPVLLTHMLEIPPTWLAATAVAAFLGHLYPVFFRFHGGKGVATFLGVLLALSWPTALVFLAVWGLMVAAFRYSSLAALTAAATAPLAAWLLALPAPVVGGLVVMTGFIYWRHRPNIAKLLAGTESRVGKDRSPPPTAGV